MEMDKIIARLYKNYPYKADLPAAFTYYKNKYLYIDLLEIFYNNKFSIQNIINNSIENDIIINKKYWKYLLCDFIDHFYNLQIEPSKDLMKQSKSSFFQFIISNIFVNKNDSIENYKLVFDNINVIDEHYNKLLNDIFGDFVEYCVEFVEKETLNIELKNIIKILDFISKIRDGNKKDEFYSFIRPLLFEYESLSGKIRAKIEINKYKDSKEIKKDIKLLLNNYNIEFNKNFCIAEYGYLKLIKKCLKEKDTNSKDFIILYFNLLNQKKLESYIKNSENDDIKNYNLSKILNTDININITNENINNDIIQNNEINQYITNSNIINSNNNENISKINKIDININNEINDNNNINNIKHPNDNTSISENKNLSNDSIESEFDINEQNEDLINNTEMIQALKNDLCPFSIRDYFIEQISKYSDKLSKNSIFRKYITKYNYKIKNDVYNNIDKKSFPVIHLIYSLLLIQINDSTKKYDKTFGFIVTDKKEFLYTYHNEELIETFLYESEKRDQYEYDDSINSTNYKELKSIDNLNKSNKSVKIYKNNISIF